MTAPDPLIALCECVVVNGLLALACLRYAGRGRSRLAWLDAGLLFYAVQYLAVGLPGIFGALTWPVAAGVALVCAALLWFASNARQTDWSVELKPTASAGVALFAACFVGAYLYFSRFNPIPANDALTYHFPAAVRWLQTRRITLLPTWFFNPSNTYSPLAGSMFIAWLMLPFQSDALARFVEAPVLLAVGGCIYALARTVGVERLTAWLLVAAAMVSRPFLHQVLLGKDDLFVDFFFLSAVLAAMPDRITQREGAARLGVALGLLLATKYTALLTLPVLLLVVNRAWGLRGVAPAAAVAALLAGPWYLRNGVLTGNPIFPVACPGGLGRALFTSAASEQLRSLRGILDVLTASQGMPPVLLVMGGLALIAAIIWRNRMREPLWRVAVLGPIVGVGLFIATAPFPEARFVQPEFALGVVAVGIALSQVPSAFFQRVAALAILGIALATTINWKSIDVTLLCTTEGATWAAVGLAVLWATHRWRGMRLPVAVAALLVAVGYTFVYFDAYLRDCGDLRLANTSPWQAAYPQEAPLWEYIADNVPESTTLAYTNTYLLYPLQGRNLLRRVVYAPTRAGVRTIADLPWLGSALSGEALVVAACKATASRPDRAVWLQNLRQSGAEYLLIVRGGVIGAPPEAAFAAADPARFVRLFESPGGVLYQLRW